MESTSSDNPTGPIVIDLEATQNPRNKRPHADSEIEDGVLKSPKKPYSEPTAQETLTEAATAESKNGTVPTFLADAFGVPGLRYYPNFIDKTEERDLLQSIDSSAWDTTLKRRVQHYGLRYDYTSKSVDKNATIDPLPSFTVPVVAKLNEEAVFPSEPDQLIVNEYEPGQGINAHIDRVESFGPVVASLSLGSPAIMSFSIGAKSVDVLLERRSMAVLTGDARFKWKHAIAARKSDVWKGAKITRGRRVSCTFRTVKREPKVAASSSTSSQ